MVRLGAMVGPQAMAKVCLWLGQRLSCCEASALKKFQAGSNSQDPKPHSATHSPSHKGPFPVCLEAADSLIKK